MSEHQRLFFALWPSEEQRSEWGRLVSESFSPQAGCLVQPENYHITILFAGNVSQDQALCLEQLAATVRADPFTLRLDHFGHWCRPRVWWWGASEHPRTLMDLVHNLQTGAAQCGIEVDKRPYQAHMTLARKVKQPPQPPPIDPVEWLVDEFVLVNSLVTSEGVRYKIQKRWPFKVNI